LESLRLGPLDIHFELLPPLHCFEVGLLLWRGLLLLDLSLSQVYKLEVVLLGEVEHTLFAEDFTMVTTWH